VLSSRLDFVADPAFFAGNQNLIFEMASIDYHSCAIPNDGFIPLFKTGSFGPGQRYLAMPQEVLSEKK